MGVEQLRIEVTDGGTTRVVERSLLGIGTAGDKAGKQAKEGVDKIRRAARDAAPQVDVLGKALRGIALYLGVRQIVEYADAYVNLQNRLRLVTSSQNELISVTNRLQVISNTTRQSLEATGEMYSRLAVAGKTLGISQEQALRVTETLNKAIALSGATSIEARGGLIQLSQGIASGVLRGDELRSVLEQLPAVADVIAEHLGITRGRLRELGEQGAISSKQVIDAFLQAGTAIDEKFAKTVSTVGQAFTVLGNNLLVAIGKFGTGSGALKTFTDAIRFTAEHIGILIGALTTLALIAIPRVVASLTSLAIALAANPIGLIAITIGAVTTAFIELGGSLQDFVLGLEPITRITVQTAGVIVGLFTGLGAAAIVFAKNVPAAVGDLAIGAFNFVLGAIQKFISAAVVEMNNLISSAEALATQVSGLVGGKSAKFGSITIPVFDELKNPLEGSAAELGKSTGKAFFTGFDFYTKEALDKVKIFFDDARKKRFEAINDRSKSGTTSLDGGKPQGSPLIGVQALERLKAELDVQRDISALGALSSNELKVQTELGKLKLDLLRQHQNLNQKEVQDALVTAEAQIREINLLKVQQSIKQETRSAQGQLEIEKELVGVYGAERSVLEEMLKTRRELQEAGADLSDKNVQNMLREHEAATRALATEKERLAVLESIRGPVAAQVALQMQLNALYDSGTISLAEYGKALDDNNLKVDTFNGFLGGLVGELAAVDASLRKMGQTIGQSITGAIGQASSALADFAVDGARNARSLQQAFSDLFKNLAKQILQAIIQMLILKAVEATVGGGLGGLLGGGGGGSPTASSAGLASATGGYSDVLPQHAHGGDVLGNRPIVVGEQGPEIWTPPANGRIIPNDQIGGGRPVVNIAPVITLDTKDVSSAMDTPEGERIIMKAVSKNSRALGRI